MIAAEHTILVLLAAGKSARFEGHRSKLDEPLDGVPLGLHAAQTLASVPFRRRVAIVSRCRIDYTAHGFHTVENDDSVGDMASSLRLGVADAQKHDAAAILVALADMPRVTAAHVRRLLDTAQGPDAVVASTSPNAPPRPPAVFGRHLFAPLLSLTGDHGARDLIRTAGHVEAPASELVDIDTRDDLGALQPSSSRT
ncbi:nucleotidyltransferase family protein [Sphingomonas jeddahensis]|uniref:Purine catabolism protein PucB n=1 Tax=Sphingomonas jeddahensis TaxID=1915074 RepID=A0A1V2EU07_9SPHN|nr:nucleotidyltransferase family protein [Sphingomonas jeddahensis]ONF96151.1 Purine catabolism protein PucB [Sphingomonas jeddahensis]